MTRAEIALANPEALLIDGFDDANADMFDVAILGVTTSGSVVYDVAKIISILRTHGNMDEEAAHSLFGQNIECLGPN